METGRIIEHPLTAPVIAEATGLVDRHALRALDSIQLATAMIAQGTHANAARTVTFVASDRKLLTAAELEGFRTWNPALGPLQS